MNKNRILLVVMVVSCIIAFSLNATAQVVVLQPKTGKESKLSSELRAALDYLRAQKVPSEKAAWESKLLVPDVRLAKRDAAGTVRVRVAVRDMRGEHLAQLEALGVVVQISDEASRVLQARMPVERIDEIAALPFVRSISLPERVVTSAGSVTTEGDVLLYADQVRNTLGFTGSTVKVGVISDGLAYLSTSQSSGNLPSVTYHSFREDGRIDLGFDGTYSGEGTALLEIIYDIAPGAQLYFANFETVLEFLQAKEWLAGQGCSIIVDDISVFNNGSYDGRSPVSLASSALVNRGITYLTAVGNLAQDHYEANYVPGTNVGANPADNIRAHVFSSATGDEFFAVQIPAGQAVSILLQWNDQFGLSYNDYDLYLLKSAAHNYSSSNVYAVSSDYQVGSQDPVEAIGYYNSGSTPVTAYIVIVGINTEIRTLDMFVLGASSLEYVTPQGSVVNNGDADGAISVGAVYWDDPNTIEPYSSWGPTNDGRLKPELVGPDGVSTAVSGFNPFYGTSASVAHLGGVAALMLGKNPSLMPVDILYIMRAHAIGLGSPIPNNIYGYGRPNAYDSEIGFIQALFRYDFEGDNAQGWTFSDVPGVFDAPGSSISSGRLYLTKTSSNCFGFWEGPLLPVQSTKVYKMTYTIGTTAASGQAPAFRLRMNVGNGQGYADLGLDSIYSGDDSPSASQSKTYTAYYFPPPTAVTYGVRPSFDIMGFSPEDPNGQSVFLEEIEIRALQKSPE